MLRTLSDNTGESSGRSAPNPSTTHHTVITGPVNIPQPEKLDLSSGNLPVKWQSSMVLEKMEKYCIGECNETYKIYVFNQRDQESNESVDAYVTAVTVN